MELFSKIANSLQNTAQEKALLSSRGVLCALSGGADSVFLLTFLTDYLKSTDVKVCAAHFNHKIRGKEADRDEAFCRELCQKLNVEFFSGSADVPKIAEEKSIGLEECARRERYSFLLGIAEEHSLSLATAHNASDNTETLILNLARGSGINGMRGIAPVRYENTTAIIRPLLSVSGEEIRNYLYENGIGFVVDSTNGDVAYSRNYVRHVIVPALKNINPEIDSAAARLASSAREANEFIKKEAEKYVSDEPVDRGTLASLDDALLHEVIARLYESASGTRNNLSDCVVSETASLIKSERQGQYVFPGNFVICVDKGFVYFKSENTEVPKSVDLPENRLVRFGDYLVGYYNSAELFDAVDSNIYNLFIYSKINCDNIKGRVFVRTRETGDTVCEHSVNKKLKKLLCDRNVPLHLRSSWPVFCDAEGIIYVPDTVVSDRVFTKSTDGAAFLVVCKECR